MNSKNVIVIAVIAAVTGLVGYMAGGGSGTPGTEVRPAAPMADFDAANPHAGLPTAAESDVIRGLEERLDKNPDDWQALSGLGDTHFDARRFDEAITYYTKAIKVNPDDIDSYNDLGLAHHYVGESELGVKVLDEGIAKNKHFQRIWLTKGFVLAYGIGDLNEARSAWEKARGIDPESQIGKAASDFLDQFKDK